MKLDLCITLMIKKLNKNFKLLTHIFIYIYSLFNENKQYFLESIVIISMAIKQTAQLFFTVL